MGKHPLVSIIIPAWNEEAVINDTIDSLLKLNYPREEYEILIVAGGKDRTYEKAGKYEDSGKPPKCIVLKQEGLGKNAAIQKGVKNSHGAIVVVLDADCRVDKNWLSELIAPLANDDYDAAGGIYYPKKINWISVFFLVQMLQAKLIAQIGGLCHGGGVAIKKSVVDRIGVENLFDQNVYTGVDAHMTLLLQERRHPIKFVKKAVTSTELPTDLSEFLKLNFRWMKSGYLISRDKFYRRILFSSPESGTLSIPKSLAIVGAAAGIPSYFLLDYPLNTVILMASLSILAFLTYRIAKVIINVNKAEPSIDLRYVPTQFLLTLLLQATNIAAFLSSLFSRNERNLKNFKGPR